MSGRHRLQKLQDEGEEGVFHPSSPRTPAPPGLLLTNANQAACVISTPNVERGDVVLHTILAASSILKHIDAPSCSLGGTQHFQLLSSLSISRLGRVCPGSTGTSTVLPSETLQTPLLFLPLLSATPSPTGLQEAWALGDLDKTLCPSGPHLKNGHLENSSHLSCLCGATCASSCQLTSTIYNNVPLAP